jgi:hypothetical protein
MNKCGYCAVGLPHRPYVIPTPQIACTLVRRGYREIHNFSALLRNCLSRSEPRSSVNPIRVGAENCRRAVACISEDVALQRRFRDLRQALRCEPGAEEMANRIADYMESCLRMSVQSELDRLGRTGGAPDCLFQEAQIRGVQEVPHCADTWRRRRFEGVNTRVFAPISLCTGGSATEAYEWP